MRARASPSADVMTETKLDTPAAPTSPTSTLGAVVPSGRAIRTDEKRTATPGMARPAVSRTTIWSGCDSGASIVSVTFSPAIKVLPGTGSRSLRGAVDSLPHPARGAARGRKRRRCALRRTHDRIGFTIELENAMRTTASHYD